MTTPQTAIDRPNSKHSLVVAMATRYQLEPGKFLNILEKTIFPNDRAANQEQIAAFLVVANQYQLNPFIKEIYAFPGKGGGITPIVSVDGWLTIINRQPSLDGIVYEDHLNAEGKLTAITCSIYRKDRSRPNAVTEYMGECRRNTDTWTKWPSRMLRHKALIQCARQAFGLAGIYDPDEAERIADTDGAVVHPIAERTRERTDALSRKLQAAPDDTPDVVFADAEIVDIETETVGEPEASAADELLDLRNHVTGLLDARDKKDQKNIMAGRKLIRDMTRDELLDLEQATQA